MKNLLSIFFFLSFTQVMGQLQTCPININFSQANLDHWFGYTGLYTKGTARQAADQIIYDSTSNFPTGTKNAVAIPEYNMSNTGLELITSNSLDPFGGFETIPTINGYSYDYAIRVGSSTINTGSTRNTDYGGLFRGLGYTIHVPAGPATQPYVITYAYAMVLESAPHENNQVPMFTAKLNTNSGTIECADALYLLPTTSNGSSYVLDQAAALQKGFSQSSTPSPNSNGNANETPYRVWTKGWTEVIFDLAQYRGQDVTLTFESDNCVPSGHFAYAYVAIKNICAGLEIAGTTIACTNGNLTYAIPELTNATYEWVIPNGWQTVNSSMNSNTITVIPDSNPGVIIAKARNGCADLTANINVTITPPTIPGTITGDTAVCYGLNPNQTFPVTLNGNRGKVLNWISSTDKGASWTNIFDTSAQLSIKNLTKSTIYRAVIQNGAACRIDSTNAALIEVNNKPVAGTISPDNIQVCLDQSMLNALTLNGSSGKIYNWQSSTDLINWTTISTSTKDTVQGITNIQGKTYFRTVVSNPGCPSDTSSKANVGIYNVHFPKASIQKDTTICFGTAANLNATILTGTTYQWTNPSQIFNGGNGVVTGTPYLIQAKVAPSKKTDYIISISNAGCPNLLFDTIHVNVLAALKVNAGRDTSVLIDQPLQLNALQSDSRKANYTWSPSTGLNSTTIANPIASFDGSVDNIRYTVSIVDSAGCSASDNVLVSINRNGPNIFMPTGFTPNSDGKNDLLKPTVYGITQDFYFSIYNRWGQQVFFTTEIGKGWDGNLNGTMQPSGTYVFVTEGKDYLGRKITRTGSAVLIR